MYKHTHLGKTAALYFSGTGNTRFALAVLAHGLGMDTDSLVSIEDDPNKAESLLSAAETAIIAYPTYMYVLPKNLHDYLVEHQAWFVGKKIITLVTYERDRFDADLLVGRLFKKLGIDIVEYSGFGVQMPQVVGDMKLMKATDVQTVVSRKKTAQEKLVAYANKLNAGEQIHEGQPKDRPLAFFRQRMFYQGRMKKYYKKVKVNDSCTACGLCVKQCPMQNFSIRDNKAEAAEQCIQCYRCVNLCPFQAITVWGNKVYWQYKGLPK